MAAYKLGLTNAYMGAVAGDGGMGTVLTIIGDTEEGSPTFTQEEPTKTDFRTEESDSPIMSIVTAAGKKSYTWNCNNVDAATMVKFFGGAIVAGTPERWNSPLVSTEIYASLRLVWRNFGNVDFPYVKITARNLLSFKRTELSKIGITADILQPTKAGTSDMSIVYATS